MRLNDTGFGHRLRVSRVDAKMTQRQLASAMSVAHPTVSNWELEKTSPSLGQVAELAIALDVFPPWLAFGWGKRR